MGAILEVISMERLSFYIVDVFAVARLTGNQLAVFRNAGSLSSDEMQQIAREMHYSETTFILSDEEKDGGYDVRIFTPARELPFAGHPTLGTAFTIQHEIIQKPVEKVLLNLKVGQIPVTFQKTGNEEVLWMTQKEPSFGRIIDKKLIADTLSIPEAWIDSRFPVEEVSTGLPFIIVPLVNLKALKESKVDKVRFFKLVENLEAKEVLVFCPESYKENDLSVRVYADYSDVPEDPATGSGNGCLAGYLVEHSYFGNDAIDIKVDQGYEIGRPSLLMLRAKKNEGKIIVEVGGQVFPVARGNLV